MDKINQRIAAELGVGVGQVAATVELLVFAAGLLVFAAGLSLWYLPAGLIGGGAVLMAIALFGDKPR